MVTVSVTFRRVGVLKAPLSASTFVTLKRPMSSFSGPIRRDSNIVKFIVSKIGADYDI